jgi:hypothetical protein
MKPNKALGPDGLTADFYKKNIGALWVMIFAKQS